MIRLYQLVFFTFLLGLSNFADAGRLVSKPPNLWTVIVEVGHIYRIICDQSGNLTMESRYVYPEDRNYSLTLYEDAISPSEAKDIYDSALKTLEEFTFAKAFDDLNTMDASDVSVQLSIGSKNLRATFYPEDSAPPGLQHIREFCGKREAIPWFWSRDIPKEIGTGSAPKNRTVAQVRGLFKGLAKPLSLKKAIDLLGRPDGFSTHFGVSVERCFQYPGKRGGTLRFLLEDDTELLLWSPDFSKIHYAIRVGPKKDDGEDLYKMPGRR